MLSFTLTLYLEEKGICHSIFPGFGKMDGLNSGFSYRGGLTLSGQPFSYYLSSTKCGTKIR